MALVAGTVTINPDGSATKTAGSLAEAIYDAFVDNFEADAGMPMPGGAKSVDIKKGFATMATRLAVIAPHIVANAVVHTTVKVVAAHGAVQFVPDAVLSKLLPPMAPPVACDGPLGDVTLDNQDVGTIT